MGMCSCGCRSTLTDTCPPSWGQTLKRRPKDKSCRSRRARKEHRLSHGHTISRRCINGVALIEHVEDDQPDVVPLFELPSDHRFKQRVAGDRCQIGIIDKSALRNDACANRADRPNRPAKGDLGFNPMRGRPGEPIISVYRVRPKPCALIRSEEHTSELQSLMRISYAVFCLKKKKHT